MTAFQRLFGSGPAILLQELLLIMLAVYAQQLTGLRRPPWPWSVGVVAGLLTVTLSFSFCLWSLHVLPFNERGKRLVTSGPFRWVRHPLYAGMLFGAGSISLFFGHTYFGLLIWILSYPLAHRLIRYEEHLLQKRFGAEWNDYASRTPRFFPSVIAFRDRDRPIVLVIVLVIGFASH